MLDLTRAELGARLSPDARLATPRPTMNILDILSPKAIKVPLASTDKKGAIDELVDLLASTGLITQPDQLKKVVWEREQQRTTGIGEGLAIPHGKCNCSKSLVIAIGRPAQPIDFGSIDNKPVKLIVLLASPADKTSDHIQALGRISRLMADPKFRIAAFTAPSAQALYDQFAQAEKAPV
jgi:fructose-specific phosphotransferase system IIA component